MFKIALLILVLIYMGVYGYPRTPANSKQSKIYFPSESEEEDRYKEFNVRNQRVPKKGIIYYPPDDYDDDNDKELQKLITKDKLKNVPEDVDNRFLFITVDNCKCKLRSGRCSKRQTC